ncbi:hypothetical protein [Novosphingobium sp. PhB55]|uniref:hypothetical protein n=1 Tax=Novosphingobium sp. PhB55 TaxID=2485106 RepID=UPI00106591E3|nr:hypothetical protein [Novosphingobium sp. PhB55]
MIDDTAERGSPEQTWDTLYAKVNAWRGECMHHISCVEQAVTETLLAIDTAFPTLHVKLRHLTGQRFEDLLAVLATDGRFGEHGAKVVDALTHYRSSHEAFRASLCHGVIKVLLERGGRPTILIRSLTIRARQAEKVTLALEEVEATAKVEALRRDRMKLVGLLAHVRRNVAGTHRPTPLANGA